MNNGCSAKTRSFFAAGLFIISTSFLQSQTSREYNIKAIFLYKLTQFVEWPPGVFQNLEEPYLIGILGDDPFHSSIDSAVAGEKVKGHPIVVERFDDINNVKNCQILFISNSMEGRLKEILSALPSKNILTVSDINDFALTGGMVRFITKANKIKLQINLPASKDADLDISSKLLQVADIVR